MSQGYSSLDSGEGESCVTGPGPVGQDLVEIPEINPRQNIFPYCLVWGPLPLITFLIPFIGHLGIATSDGKVHDFHGPYYVGKNNFMVGRVQKYVVDWVFD